MHTMASVYVSNQVVGSVSPWIVPDSPDPALRQASLTAFSQEIEWAAHLTVQACILPPPPSGACSPFYARAVNQAIASGAASMALWVQIPAGTAGSGTATADADGKGSLAPEDDSWEWWNALRFACWHSTRLGLALEVGADLPPDANLARWWGEPLKAIILRTETFMSNRRGYPALSKRHQDFLAEAFKRGIQVVLAGESRHDAAALLAPPPPPPPPPTEPFPSLTEAAAAATGRFDAGPSGQTFEGDDAAQGSLHPMRLYWEYVSFLFRKQPATSEQDALEASYRDYLQAPLQPLQDNLESQTYETFERDSTKYEVYGEAVRQALLDRVPAAAAAGTETVLMVVGAGRGPIVAASLAAGRAAGRRLRVYAVEKNPNAVVHLHARAAAES